MEKEEKQELLRNIAEFESNKELINPNEAESLLMKIFQPLLSSDGFKLHQTNFTVDTGIDIIAEKEQEKIGVTFKHYKQAVGTDQVRALVGSYILGEYNRNILVSTSGFTAKARDVVAGYNPIAIQLIDIEDLKTWVSKIEAKFDESEVALVLRTFTQKIIELINRDPRTLDELEWRDMERVIAEVFRGLGFKVELTPGAKDGGKDIILECKRDDSKVYIIEVKHWRSTQKVGGKAVKDFVNVITSERRTGGLFLATYGFTENVVESMTEIERKKIRLGHEEKIISLCKTYQKYKSGIWNQEPELMSLIYDGTI